MKKVPSTYDTRFHTKHSLPIFINDTQMKLTVTPSLDHGFAEEDGEIFCYRRNYFTANVSIDLSANGFQEDCDKYYTVQYNVREEICNFMVEIEAKSGKQPIHISFYTSKRIRLPEHPKLSLVGIDSPIPGVPTSTYFERMQFRSSTPAGSKGVKRCVELSAKLYGHLENGHRVLIATSTSEPFIIRGMSPKHYIKERRLRELESAKQSEYDIGCETHSDDMMDQVTLTPVSPYDLADLRTALYDNSNVCCNTPKIYPNVIPKLMQPTLFKPYQKCHKNTIEAINYEYFLPPIPLPQFNNGVPSLPPLNWDHGLFAYSDLGNNQNTDFMEYIKDF
ncbi:meiosis-specific transcription factor ndt80 [Boothiomyces sp. JEL0838]|nr:meiosis-specific transcription factor ndt80 [Boothiomyces sp. JEL0838]